MALFTAPPRDKPVYSIGELVGMAYERAALLADDAATESLVATRLLAEWLAHASATSPAATRRGPVAARVRRPLPQPLQTRTRRLPARRSSFSSGVPGWRAAA